MGGHAGQNLALLPRGPLVLAATFGTLAVMGQGQTQLRLIGVHESGEHLLLSDGDGGRYLLPLDESLKAAARRDRPRLGQLQIEIDGAIRPREVQALMRTGLTPDEIADRTGWSAERIRRYEGPVLAERAYAAELAQKVYVRAGSDPLTLGSRVQRRLHNREIDSSRTSWDAVRSEEGNWTVSLTFVAGGRERTASWFFDLEGRSVVPANDEARWLSQDDTPSGPIPAPHPPSTDDDVMVFDVEADGGVASRRAALPEPIDLMQAMRDGSARNRRRRRRAASPTDLPLEPSPDALPLEEMGYDPTTMQDPPAARGIHPDDAADSGGAGAGAGAPGDAGDAAFPGEAAFDVERPAGRAAGLGTDHPDRGDGAGRGDGADRKHNADRSVSASANDSVSTKDNASRHDRASTNDAGAAPRKPRPKRPSVPSWDDIMFGSRPADPPASG